MRALVSQLTVTSQRLFPGGGYLGGMLPAGPGPDEPDGRARILNVPAAVRVIVLERRSMTFVDGTWSRQDGTWSITGLDPSVAFTVIGFDDRGVVNAAVQDWVKPHVPEP